MSQQRISTTDHLTLVNLDPCKVRTMVTVVIEVAFHTEEQHRLRGLG